MFIQGDLQAVFDALYEMGVIDPVLAMDWEALTVEMAKDPRELSKAFEIINSCKGNRDLMVSQLNVLDEKSLSYVAMEVAREFAEFQSRKDLH